MKLVNIIPPVYIFLSIVITILFHFLLPGKKIFFFPWNILGAIPLAFGVMINLSADKSFKKKETTVKPLEEPTLLITTGAFRISRHPMYLGFVMILLGLAVLMGSLTPYIVVLLFAIFMDVVFIRFEEKRIEEKFGQDWLDYKKKVRRWI
jgi:protein-S-isoprenylcysteine O-methyltransferase Ste14